MTKRKEKQTVTYSRQVVINFTLELPVGTYVEPTDEDMADHLESMLYDSVAPKEMFTACHIEVTENKGGNRDE